MVNAFEKATGIKVLMTRKSSGEFYAQLKAEAANPRGDVWWGGTGDPHLQAAEEGLTEEYQSPMLAELRDWAVSQAEASGHKTVGIYAGALGIGYNTELLEQKGLPAPKCWKDLADPAYKGRDPDRQPELVRHRLHDARHARADLRRGRGLRAAQGDAQERQPV